MEEVYASFSGNPKPRRLAVCPCCMDENMVAALLSNQMRKLSAENLWHYAHTVLLTSGSVADFRYFLPRMLELRLNDRHGAIDLESLLGKLRLADWTDWTDGEQQALHDLFDAAFDGAIEQTDDPGYEVDSWICALALAGIDVLPYLRKLESPERLSVLVSFYEHNSQTLTKGRLGNSFWAGRKVEAAPVVAWFQSPSIQQAVTRYYQLAS